MVKIRSSKYQVTYNKRDGIVRVFDIYENGRIQEKVNGEINFMVNVDDFLNIIDELIQMEESLAKQTKAEPLIAKPHLTRANYYKSIKFFVMEKKGRL